MSSRGIVDLRKLKPGSHFSSRARLPLRETPKRETLRTRRRKRRLIGAAALAIAALCGGYGLSYASYVPQFSIQDIRIVGAMELDDETLHRHVQGILFNGSTTLFSRANIFLLPKEQIKASLAQNFPRIELADVSRESLTATAVVISIKEREAYARWCADEHNCYLMDRSGFLFAEANATNTDATTAYTLHGGLFATSSPIGQTYLPGRLSSLWAFLDRLVQDGYAPQEIRVNGEDFEISFARGFDLRASFGANVIELMRDLDLVLSSDSLKDSHHEIEYIDLRFGNRVYYKLKGESHQNTQ